MSDISRVVMDALRQQLRDLEFDAVLIKGKTEQPRSTIDWLEHGELPKGRPPKRKSEVVEMPTSALNPYPSPPYAAQQQALNIVPQRVESGVHEPPEAA